MLPCVLISVFALSGCAAQQSDQAKILDREREQRVSTLEKNVESLNEQISMLNNRVYEVRGRNGRPTGMMVMPVNSTETVATPQPHPRQVVHHAKEQHKPVAQKKKGQRLVATAPHSVKPQKPVGAESAPMALPPSGPTAALPPQTPEPNVAPGLPPTQPVASDAMIGLPSETVTPKPQVQQHPASRPQTPSAKAGKGEEAQYKQALNAVRAGRTQEGMQKFRNFLQQYPNGRYAPNAEFWLGECYYSQGKYQQAIDQYKTVNSKYPSHHKSADAHLKAGMAYKKMGNQASASQEYQELYQNFPGSEAARRARSGR
ncbi:MAG: tol-pal system protein YbgF [Desulfovibrio sp.]|nr:tol-pal system protein YbgF [Desulfovibrio sp.]